LVYFTGHVDKENRDNGDGKLWTYQGEIFIGKWKNNERSEGRLY
jgi:hypothetical protein